MHLTRILRAVAALVLLWGLPVGAEPLRVSQTNPHYFEFAGKPVLLITSAEHYGMVLNTALDYQRYLDTLAAEKMNYTRLFTGTYVEKSGAFGILRNTLAPGPGKFLAPWARSSQPGYAGGGNKFDMNDWNPAYFERLRSFIQEAGKRGVFVEVTLFSSIYGDEQWSVNPFNPSNHVKAPNFADRKKIQTLDNGDALGFQEKVIRKIVRELNDLDNFFFEIQNEPWSDHHAMGDFINPYMVNDHKWPNAVEITTAESVAWQERVASWIREEEKSMAKQHLIAQNIANFRLPITGADMISQADIVHFHYAYPEAAWWNHGLGKLIGYDETGFKGSADTSYRQEAWSFILAGGGLFNNLDYSFTLGHEDGSDAAPNGPGGGSRQLRKDLTVLGDFMNSFEFVRMSPDQSTVKRCTGAMTVGLSEPGKQYAFYLRGRSPAEMSLELPRGMYQIKWVDVRTGEVLSREGLRHRSGQLVIKSPGFKDEVALSIKAE